MEGTIGEIRIFTGNFAPLYWAFCEGQTMQINEYTALYAVIGSVYGGDGLQNFKLPDLRSRIPIGTGQGPGLPDYAVGTQVGQETVILTQSQIPPHTHLATGQGGSGTAKATLNGVNNPAEKSMPEGNYLGRDTGAGATPYATAGTPVAMHAGSVAVHINVPPPTVSIGIAGGNMPHNNIQPNLALHYIICLRGDFPPRD